MRLRTLKKEGNGGIGFQFARYKYLSAKKGDYSTKKNYRASLFLEFVPVEIQSFFPFTQKTGFLPLQLKYKNIGI